MIGLVEQIDVHMGQADAFAWYMEEDPLLRSTIVTVGVLDGEPRWDMIVEGADRASRVVPGIRQIVLEPPMRIGPPRWTIDPDFDLSYHLRRIRAPEPRTLASVMDWARKTAMAGFDRARPLWEFTLIEGLEADRSAFVLKLHHSITDGIGGVQLAANLFDFERAPADRAPMPPIPEPEDFDTTDLVRDAIAYDWGRVFESVRDRAKSAVGDTTHAALHPAETVKRAAETIRSVGKFVEPVTKTLSPVMTERHIISRFDALDCDLAALKTAAKTADGSVNDGFVAGILGGLRRYHERHNATVEELRVTVPISLRTDDDRAGGNRVTLVRFKVPMDIADPGDRMRALGELTAAMRDEPALPLSNVIAGALNLLPRGVTASMLKHIDFVASNVPGLPVPVYIGGTELLAMYPFGPTIGAAVNVTLMSNVATCNMGVNMDASAIEDSDVFMTCLADGFNEVLELAGSGTTVEMPLH